MKTTYTGDDDFEQTNPLDLVVGPVFWIRPGIFIRPALSWNLNFDDRGLNSGLEELDRPPHLDRLPPRLRLPRDRGPVAPPPPPPPPANSNPTVSCEIERQEIPPGETVRVRANALRPRRRHAHLRVEREPPAASWAPGPQVTFDSTGMSPGLVRHHHRPRQRRPRRHGQLDLHGPHARRQGGQPAVTDLRGRRVPAQPGSPDQRGQGLPGRRRHPPAPGSAQPRDRRRPCRQRRAVPRGHRAAARGGREGLPGQGARHRGSRGSPRAARPPPARSTPAPTPPPGPATAGWR